MQCPNCSKEIRDTAKVCGYCGQKLQTGITKCPDCGNDKREGAKVCGYCGHNFKAALQTPEPEVEQKVSPQVPTQQLEPVQEETTPQAPDKPDNETEVKTAPPKQSDGQSSPAPKPEIMEEVVSQPASVPQKPEPIQDPVIPSDPEPKPGISPEEPPSVEIKAEPAPAPEKKEKNVSEVIPEPQKSKSEMKSVSRKKVPTWIWVVLGLIGIGALVAVFYFTSNRLPTQVTEVLPGAKIVEKENFNGEPTIALDMHRESISSGQAKITGNGEFISSYIIYDRFIEVGEGTLALFMIDPKYKDEQWWLIQLYTRKNGEYFSSVGFSEWYHPYYDVRQEYGAESNFIGVRTAPKIGVWYYVLYAVLEDDEILVRIWEKDNPSKSSEYTWHLEPELTGQTWRSAIFAHNGTIYVDSFTIISFR